MIDTIAGYRSTFSFWYAMEFLRIPGICVWRILESLFSKVLCANDCHNVNQKVNVREFVSTDDCFYVNSTCKHSIMHTHTHTILDLKVCCAGV